MVSFKLPDHSKPSKATSQPKDHRPAVLSCAQIVKRDDGSELHVTNGFIAARIPLILIDEDDAITLPKLVSAPALAAWEKSRPKKIAMTEDGRAEVSEARYSEPDAKVDGVSYPNLDNLWPTPKRTFTVALNAKLLLSLAQAMGSDHLEITFDVDRPANAATVRTDANESTGLIMPRRCDNMGLHENASDYVQ